jgi:hypothetical protein
MTALDPTGQPDEDVMLLDGLNNPGFSGRPVITRLGDETLLAWFESSGSPVLIRNKVHARCFVGGL